MGKKRRSMELEREGKSHPRSRGRFTKSMPTAFEDIVLTFLFKAKEPTSQAAINELLTNHGAGKKDCQHTLDSLVKQGEIQRDGKRRFSITGTAPVYAGMLTQHPKGFGFLGNACDYQGRKPAFRRDPYIAPGRMGGAQHGDTVLIRVLRVRKDLRPEAVVIDITKHASNRITGILRQEKQSFLVYPDDPRFPFVIKIEKPYDDTLVDGKVVLVEYERQDTPTRIVLGKILEVIGDYASLATQARLVIEQFALPTTFSEEALREVEQLDNPAVLPEGREDLREIAHITIDGETAKDFDDAICVVRQKKGYRLYVSIADVSYFVQPGSAIDLEAYNRGTSVYFPGMVLPMLPEKLSNDLCSLRPEQERLAVSAILDFDQAGTLTGRRFTRSVIRSRQRFTYTQVKQILVDKDPLVRKTFKPFLTDLGWAEKLAMALQAKRRHRGALDFSVPEPEFNLDGDSVTDVRPTERNFAHQIIEEFMLAANEAIAELATAKAIPMLYRVHEPPDQEKTEEFLGFARSLGLLLPPMADGPKWFANFLDTCRGTKYEYIINTLLLRNMQQAHYAAENVGHFGLASSDYTHFTSPIRRYPDLMVHRTLLRIIGAEKTTEEKTSPSPSFFSAGEFLSQRERTAMLAEREMDDRLKVISMQNHIGDTFQAIISGVSDSAIFIEIPDHCVSGAIATDSLTDDYYLLDSKKHRLFGEITAKIYQIGDSLEVTLTDIDRSRRHLNFLLAKKAKA